MFSRIKWPMATAFVTLTFILPSATHAQERDVLNAVESVAGIYSSIYFHEAGHALAAKAFGATDVVIEVPRKGSIMNGGMTAQFPVPLSPTQRQIFVASGLLAANVAGEFVLQQPGLHASPFAQSILGTSIVSNFIHVTQYYTRIRGVKGWMGNDIDQYELAGGNPHAFSAVLVAYSLWTLQRMQKRDVPLFFVSLRF